MGKWKTIRVPNAAYFLTCVVVGHTPVFTASGIIRILIDNLNFYRSKCGFKLLGYVIMPDHLHLLILLKEKSNISDIMRDFKGYTSKRITAYLKENGKTEILSRLKEHATKEVKNPFWMEGNKPIAAYSEKVLKTKLDYIHNNPVKRGLVDSVEDYPHSSFRNYHFDDDSLIVVDRDWSLP